MTPTRRTVTIDATKKRWQRAHVRTVETLAAWGEVLPIRPGKTVDYDSPAIGAYVRVCLDFVPDDIMAALESFRSRYGRRVFVHVYQAKDDKPLSIEVSPSSVK
jgi:phage baseplate assembly protein gpV